MIRHRFFPACPFWLTIFLGSVAGIQASADDPQGVLRFFGHGWGTGYHARPNCGPAADVPGWVQVRHCVDRYSRRNFENHALGHCNPGSPCIGGYQNGFGHPGISPIGFQLDIEAPAPYSLQNEYYGAPASSTGPGRQPVYRQPALIEAPFPTPETTNFRNQESPLPRQPRTTIESETLPELDVTDEAQSPSSPERNSGTRQNPFGVDGSTSGNFNTAPGYPSHRMPQAPSPTGLRAYPQLNQAGLVPPAQYVAPQRSILRTVSPSNTFNGIR